MSDKIYIVKCASGEWDSYAWWIGGTSTDKEIADKICQDINDKAKEFIDACPVKLSDDSTDEEEKIYYNYFFNEDGDKNYLREWQGAIVQEFDANVNLNK